MIEREEGCRLNAIGEVLPRRRLCVVSTLHLSKQCDAWLPPIDMVKICQPPCLFSGCADSLAACLFVYSLSRSKQVPSLFLPPPLPLSLPPHPLSLCNTYKAPCADLFRWYLCCEVMSKYLFRKYRLHHLQRSQEASLARLMNCVFLEVASHMSLL